MTASMRPVGNQAKTVSIKPNRKRKIFDKVDAARREDRPAAGAGKGRWRRCYLCCPVAEEAAALSTLRRRLVPRGLTLPCAAVDLQSEVWRKSSRMTASSRRCTARGWTGGRRPGLARIVGGGAATSVAHPAADASPLGHLPHFQP